MTIEELHSFLIGAFDLVTDPVERGSAQTYFISKAVWHPAATTRILQVRWGVNNDVSHIKLCVSSDNNNSVFVRLPVTWSELKQIVANEISLHSGNRMMNT
ncbi:hypothetical protein N5B55_21490 [Ralstonia pickettii]|uniref:hypothetical protein n=1 Tax=Ralstonia pickettii TaxID=329 RepID=UPI0027147E98|nr:hypothetical protein [Ralstonia pickettii]WKZ87331.1 hypothetical protein N5B55_21490 [Ralstonia pickettii]